MNEKCYAIVKHVRQDFNGETYVLAVTGNEELAKKRFNEAVAAEKSQQEKSVKSELIQNYGALNH